MRKLATYQYSDVLRSSPYGKSVPGTVTSVRSKWQRSNPTKYMDVPLETKRILRRRNGRELARDMERAGGATSPEGRAYAAVLEERGVNPNLAKENINMARTTPNDMFKRALWESFSDEMLKLSNDMTSQQRMQYDPQYAGLKSYGLTSAAPAAIGATGGGALGAALGSGAGLKGALIGGAAGATLGGVGVYKSLKKQENAPGFDKALEISHGQG